jgi:putative endonuclease
VASHAKGVLRSAKREGGRASQAKGVPVARSREGGLFGGAVVRCSYARQPGLTVSVDGPVAPSSFLAICPGTDVAHRAVVIPPKRFVYVLRSLSDRDRYYTGVTSDVRARLCAHNAGECVHAESPVELDVVIAFRNEARALAFERYLKSGSGCAFAQRHLR